MTSFLGWPGAIGDLGIVALERISPLEEDQVTEYGQQIKDAYHEAFGLTAITIKVCPSAGAKQLEQEQAGS